MNNKTLLLTLSFTLGTLFTNAQSLPGFQWGEGMGTPDLSWTAQVGAKTYPKGKIFQAADYGLKNDSTRLSTAALQKAIDECHRSGGGTVEVAPGYYRIGAIYLKSNVNLHLNQGTTLIASEDIDLYPEMRSRVAGIEMVWPSAVINILDAENAAISGAGTLDCRGKIFWDKYWTMRKDYEKRKLRWIVDYDCKRVRGMLISNSRQITLKDFTLMRTGFWGCQVLYSDQCTLNGLKINNNIGGHGPSTDGIDIDSSTNILIENCEVDCNDDNICLKAGRDADGLRVNRPTENIIVRGCIARKGAGLITCGSETSGCIRNVLGYNLQAYGTSSTLRLKSAMNRGGTVENIYMTQVTADHVRHVLAADLNWNPSYSYSTLPAEYEGKEIPEHWKVMLTPVTPKEKGYPHFRNVWLSDVKATNVQTFITAAGWNEELPLQNFHISGIKAKVNKAGSIIFTEDFHLEDVRLQVEDGSRVEEKNNKNAQIDISYENNMEL